MITRRKENYIGTHIKDQVVFCFYFDEETYEDERKVATGIFNIDGIKKQISEALLNQLHTELNITCMTKLVKEVFVDVSNVYYPSMSDYSGRSRPSNRSDGDINMDFYTDYLIQRETKKGMTFNLYWGFVCPCTIGRFSRKDKKFREISNNMLSKCEIM